jgi:predicted Zn-dependent protease
VRFGARKLLFGLAVCLAACATSPLGRDQLILFPEEQVAQMGAAAFQELKANTAISGDPDATAYVRCVAGAIIESSAIGGEWEVAVFDGDQVNAFALPGGKIGVYEGLLSVAENQDQLATVIAHEISHVIAQHSNERISTQYAASAGLDLVGAVAGQETPLKRTLFGLLGIGTQVGVLLPFSRSQETEADLLGLDLMAKAGFDPRQSIELWRNMMRSADDSPPEFLSTHPSGETRIEALEERMPAALSLAESATAKPNCR